MTNGQTNGLTELFLKSLSRLKIQNMAKSEFFYISLLHLLLSFFYSKANNIIGKFNICHFSIFQYFDYYVPIMSSGLSREALSYLMMFVSLSRTRIWNVWFIPPSKPGTHLMWKVSDDLLITEQFSTGSGATEIRGKYLDNFLVKSISSTI